jgi:hypothetical protein
MMLRWSRGKKAPIWPDEGEIKSWAKRNAPVQKQDRKERTSFCEQKEAKKLYLF